MDQKTVVILLSDKRSGSTMFQDEICKHPEIQTVAYSPHTYLETHHWLKGAVVLGMAPENFAGGKIYPGYGSRTNARAYLIDCICGNVPGYEVPPDDRSLVFAGWEALCAQFAKPVFFEKSPQLLAQWAGLSLLLEWIKQTKYMVKIIGLTRNPIAVQYSAYKLFHTNPIRRQYAWLETHKNLLAFSALLPQEDYLHLRYEKIIEQPKAAFEAVCNFIGVSGYPEIGMGVNPDSLTRWKEDPYFNFKLDPVVAQMASYLGYREDELDNPPKPEPPLSYQLQESWERISKLTLARLKDRIVKPMYLKLRNASQIVAGNEDG